MMSDSYGEPHASLFPCALQIAALKGIFQEDSPWRLDPLLSHL